MSLSSLRTRTSISDSGFNPDFYFFYFISQFLSFLFQNVDFNQLWGQISNNNMNNNTSLKKSFFDIQFKTFFRLLLKTKTVTKKKIMFNQKTKNTFQCNLNSLILDLMTYFRYNYFLYTSTYIFSFVVL